MLDRVVMPERDTLGILGWPQYRVTKDQTRFMGLEKRRVSRNRGYRMSGVEVRVRHGGGLHIKEIEHDRDLESQHKDHARKEPVQGIQEPGGVGYGGMISAEYGRPVIAAVLEKQSMEKALITDELGRHIPPWLRPTGPSST